MGEPDDPSIKRPLRPSHLPQAAHKPAAQLSRDTHPLPAFDLSNTRHPRHASHTLTFDTSPPDGLADSEKLHNGSDPNTASVLAAPFSGTSSDSSPLGSGEKEQSEGDTSVAKLQKPPWSVRIKAGSKRFVNHTKNAILHSWINVLLIFVPVGIAVNFVPIPGNAKATVVFALNAIAIIPLAGLLAHATEAVASSLGDTWASLLNVSFGNAVELIIFIALAKNEIRIVQASILGSILANLLLILGMSFLFGGLRYQEQIYNSTVTQMSACLLSLAVLSLLLPTAFHASFSNNDTADTRTTQISRGTSVVLLLVYVLYLVFQLKSHAYMYQSTPQRIIDEESHPGVLADIMNGSSSNDSTSSSDTDSDTSFRSHSTAKKLRRVWKNRMTRKASIASTATGSVASGPPLHVPPCTSRDAFVGSPQSSNMMSGDEADTDCAPSRRSFASRVRDFETEQAKSAKSPAKSPERGAFRKKSKKRSKRRQRKSVDDADSLTLATSSGRAVVSSDDQSGPLTEGGVSRVNFDPEVQTIQPTADARRPFARRLDSLKSPLPSLLSHTVFSTPSHSHGTSRAPAPLSIARSAVGLRRTNSLPDRLTRQQSQVRTPSNLSHAISAEPAHRPGTLVVNEADAIRKDEEEDGVPPMSRTAAVVLLLVSTGLVAFCAELLVDRIPQMIDNTSVSQAFIGLIILPIVGNAAEHVTAVTVATKNKMDLALGVSLGSSIQIALFVTPFVVLLGWIMGKDMSLYFNLFETVSLFATAFVVNFLVLDGRSNYLEGSLLIAAYVIIAVCAFFYPNMSEQSVLGGNGVIG